jgi:hypothetical protein
VNGIAPQQTDRTGLDEPWRGNEDGMQGRQRGWKPDGRRATDRGQRHQRGRDDTRGDDIEAEIAGVMIVSFEKAASDRSNHEQHGDCRCKFAAVRGEGMPTPGAPDGNCRDWQRFSGRSQFPQLAAALRPGHRRPTAETTPRLALTPGRQHHRAASRTTTVIL